MNERPGIMLYFSNGECIKELTDADAGRLLKAFLDYGQYGELPDFEGAVKIAWLAMRPLLDRDAEHYQRLCAKKKYAVYCREQNRRNLPIVSFDTWNSDQMISSDDVCYPISTSAPASVPASVSVPAPVSVLAPAPVQVPDPVPVPNPTEIETAISAAVSTDTVSDDASAVSKKQDLRGHFGLGRRIRLTDREYMDLMNEIGFSEFNALLLSAEALAVERNYNTDTLNWPVFLRHCHKKTLPAVQS